VSELEQLVVHPDYRRRGIAKLLVDWGVKKADRFGLESCVESVPFAVPVYEKLGFVNADSLLPDVGTENPSEKWKQYAAEDLSVRLVWRPAGHNFRAGEDKVPWLDV
jgi:GNAT superfamily N-acetyltransferase